MADLKISQLSSATALAGSEVVPVVQGGSTKKATIDQILAPAAGKGINFSAAGGDTLTIYDEGAWTPTQGAGLTVVGAFSSYGYYTRIGRQVTVFGSISGATSVAANSGQVMCGGLPFPVVIPGVGTANSNTSVTAAASEVYSNANVGAVATIIFSCTYFV